MLCSVEMSMKKSFIISGPGRQLKQSNQLFLSLVKMVAKLKGIYLSKALT